MGTLGYGFCGARRAEVTGIDIAPNLVEAGNKRAAGTLIRAPFMRVTVSV